MPIKLLLVCSISLECSVEIRLCKSTRQSETLEDAGDFHLVGHGMSCAQAISKLAEGGVQLPQVNAIKARDTRRDRVMELAF